MKVEVDIFKGRDGTNGANGANGTNGTNGANGNDGDPVSFVGTALDYAGGSGLLIGSSGSYSFLDGDAFRILGASGLSDGIHVANQNFTVDKSAGSIAALTKLLSNNTKFDLFLADGAAGAAGAAGADGSDGAAGAAGSDGSAGAPGANGANGTGFTGGSYNSSSGVVTITSNDGLGFSTSDLRGADGTNGNGFTGGSYNSGTGVVTFTSSDGLGFSTSDLRSPAPSILCSQLDVKSSFINTNIGGSSTGNPADLQLTMSSINTLNATLDSDVGITVPSDGIYEFLCSVRQHGGNQRVELVIKTFIDSGSGYVEDTSAIASGYVSRSDAIDEGGTSLTRMHDLSSGDKVKFQVLSKVQSSVSSQVIAGTFVIVKKLS